jgi:hypothetical protein
VTTTASNGNSHGTAPGVRTAKTLCKRSGVGCGLSTGAGKKKATTTTTAKTATAKTTKASVQEVLASTPLGSKLDLVPLVDDSLVAMPKSSDLVAIAGKADAIIAENHLDYVAKNVASRQASRQAIIDNLDSIVANGGKLRTAKGTLKANLKPIQRTDLAWFNDVNKQWLAEQGVELTFRNGKYKASMIGTAPANSPVFVKDGELLLNILRIDQTAYLPTSVVHSSRNSIRATLKPFDGMTPDEVLAAIRDPAKMLRVTDDVHVAYVSQNRKFLTAGQERGTYLLEKHVAMLDVDEVEKVLRLVLRQDKFGMSDDAIEALLRKSRADVSKLFDDVQAAAVAEQLAKHPHNEYLLSLKAQTKKP